MTTNSSDYISLLQEFCKNNSLLFTRNKFFKNEFQISKQCDSSYENITYQQSDIISSTEIKSLNFNSVSKNIFFDFLNEKNERWNLFVEYQPLDSAWILSTIPKIPDKFFYPMIKKTKKRKFHTLSNEELSVFLNKAKNISFPFNSLIISEFLLNFKSSFKNDALVVSLINLTYDLPDIDKNHLYSSLGISNKNKKINDDDFLNEISTLSLQFDKVKLLGYLTNYLDYDSSLITKDVVWFEIQNITEFFNKPKSHKTKFIHGAISGGYNNQESSFKLHIELSDFSQKDMIKSFIIKAIHDLVDKSLQKTKTQDKKEHLKKLFQYVSLDKKLEMKNSHSSAPKI